MKRLTKKRMRENLEKKDLLQQLGFTMSNNIRAPKEHSKAKKKKTLL